MSLRMDLHCHSYYSDGTSAPFDIVRMAKEGGLSLLALTDHDTIDGVTEAQEAGRRLGVNVMPSVELDIESPYELHMLGLGLNTGNAPLNEALNELKQRRIKRNKIIIEKLNANNYKIDEYLPKVHGCMSRLHIANALIAGGYADSIQEAFVKYLLPGQVGFHKEKRLTCKEAISLIRDAGGMPVLAHPCLIRANIHRLVAELVPLGLKGIEAYYPACSDSQTALYISLAIQYGLTVTCGSDFHGDNRKGITLGCSWDDSEPLRETYEKCILMLK